jgi:biopolymer transport protein ExbD
MKFRRTLTEADDVGDINVSPLIDMVFILLIFFIVTTTFVEETGVEVDKPQAAAAASLDKNSILLAVTAKGDVVYGGQKVPINNLRPKLRTMLQQEEMPVIIQVDKNAAAGVVVRVIDAAKLAGALNVSLATEPGAG